MDKPALTRIIIVVNVGLTDLLLLLLKIGFLFVSDETDTEIMIQRRIYIYMRKLVSLPPPSVKALECSLFVF